jgi:protein TonB
MEPNQIKEADILDILFDGRNKEYGAYELRKSYNRRVVKSLFAMGSVVLLVLLGGVVSGLGKVERVGRFTVEDSVKLAGLVDPPPPPVPPPPKVVPPPQVATIRWTTRIVPDDQVKERPPANDEVKDMKIGTVNKPGDLDVGDVNGPPISNGLGASVVEAPKKQGDVDSFMPIEVEASFPGGPQAWARFLNKNFRYPEGAIDVGIAGTVVVQFIVDKDGNVSEVEAISGPATGGLREEAVRVIRKSGKWIPALQNGRYVRAIRRQPVTFLPE